MIFLLKISRGISTFCLHFKRIQRLKKLNMIFKPQKCIILVSFFNNAPLPETSEEQ